MMTLIAPATAPPQATGTHAPTTGAQVPLVGAPSDGVGAIEFGALLTQLAAQEAVPPSATPRAGMSPVSGSTSAAAEGGGPDNSAGVELAEALGPSAGQVPPMAPPAAILHDTPAHARQGPVDRAVRQNATPYLTGRPGDLAPAAPTDPAAVGGAEQAQGEEAAASGQSDPVRSTPRLPVPSEEVAVAIAQNVAAAGPGESAPARRPAESVPARRPGGQALGDGPLHAPGRSAGMGGSDLPVPVEPGAAQDDRGSLDVIGADEANLATRDEVPSGHSQPVGIAHGAPAAAESTEGRHDPRGQAGSEPVATVGPDRPPAISVHPQADGGSQVEASSPNTPASASTSATAASWPVTRQLAVAITRDMSGDTDRLTVALRPQELGMVEISVETSIEGLTRASVIAERQDTLELLRRDTAELERALRGAGIDVASGGLSFSMRDQGGSREQQRSSTALLHPPTTAASGGSLAALATAAAGSRLLDLSV